MSISAYVNQHLALLSQARSLLSVVSLDHFVSVNLPLFSSSIGAHFRHVTDHYTSFFNGIYLTPPCINYDSRKRGTSVETSLSECMEVLNALSFKLNLLENLDFPLLVSSNACFDSDYVHSSLARELKFLEAHTVHHFALISFILRFFSYEVPADFGVAPSTLQFMASASS